MKTLSHNPCPALIAAIALGSGAIQALGADDPDLALGVRKTEPVSPAAQAGTFRLPAGFEIQLVANEPDIHKPMNLAFDATGRLWVTTSIEYPWAAPTNRVGRDRVMIFEDFGPDGRARKVTQFASGLNIPIGVYPFRTDDKHWKAIVWSIPHIWLLEDTDGDGTADKRTPLYGPFDHTRDTHGNQASFRRGFDGWLYATHGFNNDSHVTARDGSHVDLNSGNTYRIRLDGSHIEHHTHGQVNPFGLAWDLRGNLYSSDCHSAPLYQLLAGGWYPSFGKPHDGLGFAPVMLEHAHGSTAIDGAVYVNDDLWPAEYRDTLFIGNVMTSRLNRDRITFEGSTPKAAEQPDFLTTSDPWFRPVDATLGPDGALYIADFYNRIIGHYEVPLTHPGRDRERGRLWRVVAKGPDGKPRLRPPALPPGLDGLVGELGSPSLSRRLLAMSEIQDRFGARALPAVRKASVSARRQAASAGRVRPASGGVATSAAADPSDRASATRVSALWLRHRLGDLGPGLTDRDFLADLADPNDPLVRVHALRVVAERGALSGEGVPLAARRTVASATLAQVRRQMASADGLEARCAAEALGQWPDADNLRPILDTLGRVPAADTHLRYVLRKALRDQLKVPAVLARAAAMPEGSGADHRAFAEVMPSIPTPGAAAYLIARLDSLGESSNPTLGEALRHAARYAPESEWDRLAGFVRRRFADQPDFQFSLFRSLDQGLQQRGAAPTPALRAWGGDLAGRLLAGGNGTAWVHTPLETPTDSPWDFQERRRSDGTAMRVLSSLPRGEQKTGILRSPEFDLGGRIAFWLCGHDGYPDRPAKQVNRVRLRDAATGGVLFEARPPRSDVLVPVAWDTRAHAGRRAVLEIVDADTGDAYAWLALGGLEGAPALPATSPSGGAARLTAAVELAARLGLRERAPEVASIVERPGDPELRAAAAKALMALDAPRAEVLQRRLLAEPAQPTALRERFGVMLAEANTVAGRAAVAAAFRTVPYRVQTQWATALTATRDGAETFLQAVEQGVASPRILQQAGARGRLQRANPDRWSERLDRLTRGLAPADEAREKLLAARRSGFDAAKADPVAGSRVFEQNCRACHQVGGAGGLVGPQLTGIGNRGVERLCEDILDPNRNVDHGFRQTRLTTRDGEELAGLFRREEGDLLVLVDPAGKEFTVGKSAVTERQESEVSLMPDSFGETLSAGDFHHLLAYLLSQR